MTSLSIFQPEIVTIETQLTALQTQLEELRQAEDIASQLLSTLSDTLPKFEKLGAIARIKSALLGLFNDENRASNLDSGKKIAQQPTTEAIFDAECLPQQPENTPNAEATQVTDAIREEAQADAIASVEAQPAEPAAPATVEPAAEPAPSVEEKPPEQVNYIEQVFLTRTVAYQKRHDGEIVCAYVGSANQKLAQNWADCVQLWGCEAEVRKAKRMSAADIRWEVKIRKISKSQLDQIAANHTSPFQSVPQVARPTEKKNAAADHSGQSATTGDAASKPQVSLVLGKADNIYVSYHVVVGDRTIGRVERLSATSAWSVPGMPGIWETKEEAADALIAKREADKKLHDDTNALLRAKYGLPV